MTQNYQKRSQSRSGMLKEKNKKSRTRFRPGRITRNPFLNFMRDFRISHNHLKITEVTRRGAEAWRKMDSKSREPYMKMAKNASKKPIKSRRNPKSRKKIERAMARSISPRKSKSRQYSNPDKSMTPSHDNKQDSKNQEKE